MRLCMARFNVQKVVVFLYTQLEKIMEKTQSKVLFDDLSNVMEDHKKEMDAFFNVFTCEDGLPHIELHGYYEIELSRINSAKELLFWVSHLSEKRWMDADKIRELICRVTWLFDLDVNSYPYDESYQKDVKWIEAKRKASK